MCPRQTLLPATTPLTLKSMTLYRDLKPGGTFLLNCPWDVTELGDHLPAAAKQYLAKNNIGFYTVDGVRLAKELGLAGKVNVILQAAFFKLANIIPIDDAVKYMKAAIATSYGRKGEQVVAIE